MWQEIKKIGEPINLDEKELKVEARLKPGGKWLRKFLPIKFFINNEGETWNQRGCFNWNIFV